MSYIALSSPFTVTLNHIPRLQPTISNPDVHQTTRQSPSSQLDREVARRVPQWKIWHKLSQPIRTRPFRRDRQLPTLHNAPPCFDRIIEKDAKPPPSRDDGRANLEVINT